MCSPGSAQGNSSAPMNWRGMGDPFQCPEPVPERVALAKVILPDAGWLPAGGERLRARWL